MQKIVPGNTIYYSSYGERKSAKVLRLSNDGKIVFLDNGRWLHITSVEI